MVGCTPEGKPDQPPVSRLEGEPLREMAVESVSDGVRPEQLEQPIAVVAESRRDGVGASDALSSEQVRVIQWNIESGGNSPAVIAEQLLELPSSHIYALSEVDQNEVYEAALDDRWPNRFGYVRGFSGRGYDRADDRLWIAYDKVRFDAIASYELLQGTTVDVYDGRHRAPLVVQLKDKVSGRQFLLVQNHLARGNADFRQQQARGLREWAQVSELPIVCVGDFNFDYEFATQRGNSGFDEFMRDDIWTWVKPQELIDSNWYDGDRDGVDDYEGSILDFCFVSPLAADWDAECRVIVREGDFPDDDTTADHRPMELVFKLQTAAE